MNTIENTQECRFCSYIKRGSGPLEIDCPWTSNEHYSAFVSLGALVPGWTIFCPTSHALNMSARYSQTDFWDFVTKATDIIKKLYGPVVIFEHGAQHESSITACGTVHAHMHVVPLNFALSTEALRYDGSLTWRHCAIRDIERVTADREYLFASDHFDGANTTGIVCLLNEPKSQFFRRVIATRLGLPELYDYKKYQLLEIATESHRQLRHEASEGEKLRFSADETAQ